MTANAGAVPTDGGTAETRSYGSRNNSVSMGSENVRANYGRSGSVAGAQAGMRHSISNDGGRLGATSWRSSGTARVVANGNGGSVAYPMALHGDDPAQPEWMADELTYDEGQSAKKMQDIEEWKRRMKEGGNAPDSHSDADQPTLAINEGAARGSRFLRMFSAPSALDPMLPVPGGPMHDMAVANAHTNGFEQQEGDSLSKLLKVFGNKVSVSNPVIDSRPSQGLPPGLAQQPTEAQAFADPAVQAAMMQMAQVSLEAPGNNPMQPAAASVLENGARSLSPASAGSGQRLKSASPAPINEALRGIVPTSVFRKSVQSSTASGGPKRPDSTTSSNRSATPARNLPSWLVELSRGRSSPSTEQALITNASLGTHDLVDTLERGFPALNTKPQHLDSQSISSLSVQASVGGPSEANAGSVRRSSIDTQGTERLADGTRTNSQAPTPEVLKGVPMIPEQPSSQEALLHPNAAMSPEPMQMQHGLAPPGMIGMPPQQQQQQQHMMLPDGTLLPGMVPPMGMMLPMGFHPNMMYGMMPPPGMFGGMPPVNVPMSQINSIPGPTNEHQQMMLMKMMMSDMPPPGMMFGQMGSGPQQMGPPPHLPPHMYSVGMAYPGMPASVPSSSEAGGAAQPTSQAFQQQQQQQQQFQHPRQQ
ncbi:hypothetical protein GGI20_001912 [Coemansia sp. BCRC 34301]|nr:hypothetical protein GGI20_001912 [Coemansia sp. BCRC 34301]